MRVSVKLMIQRNAMKILIMIDVAVKLITTITIPMTAMITTISNNSNDNPVAHDINESNDEDISKDDNGNY